MDKPFLEILLIGDSGQDTIATHLVVQGHKVTRRYDGESGLRHALSDEFTVIVLDSLTPGIDGMAVLKMIREVGQDTPILFLTHQKTIEGRVEALQAGADECLEKPFANLELEARVCAMSRRRKAGASRTKLHVADVKMDLIARVVIRDGRNIPLQPQEFRLLECLMRNAGRVLSRSELLEEVWDLRFDPGSNIVETHVSRLRGKVDRGFDNALIRTVRGSGYLIATD
jgi:two-component system, OmpR family, response regulator